MTTVAVHWSSFGPFHLARLKAAYYTLGGEGIELVGLEVTSYKKLFSWDREDTRSPFKRYVAFPGNTFEELSFVEKWKGMNSVLDDIQPAALAINGYSDFDALGALFWCKLHQRGAIIMSDTTNDWAPRFVYKENLKRLIVRQFNSALCAGRLSKRYLEGLGMQPRFIFEGLDAIDNEYFVSQAEKARSKEMEYRWLPGLEDPTPYFLASSRLVREKNIDGLIHAYSRYRIDMIGRGLQPWRLVVLGDGSEKGFLEDLVKKENIIGITFAGFHQIHEIPIYYGLASVLIHPTLKDTWGLVVNEAMAAGLPVLVSKSAGCAPDLIKEGKNGFTFDPKSIDSLANLMVTMSTGQVDLNGMGKAAKELICQWGLQRFSHGLLSAVKAAIQ